MTDEVMLNEAIEAIRQGQRQRARDLLTRLLRSDQNNPNYWLWMSAVVDTTKERVFCLQNVLQFDPENKAAKLGLVMAGALPAQESSKTPTPLKRKWEVSLPRETAGANLKKYLSNPVVRLAGLILAVLIIGGGFFFWYTFSNRPSMVILPTPTDTPLVYPTFTATPTYIGYKEPTATSTPAVISGSPTPLWMLLEATYTPTPLYVDTPHPRSEAFRIAKQAFLEGDWERALDFFNQALEVEPQAVDIQYYIGEVYRFSGQPQRALQAYMRAMAIDGNFAPAFLGKAQANLMIDPKADVEKDLNKAINLDNALTEAYLARAQYYSNNAQEAKAQKDFQTASELAPNSPQPYLYQAQAALKNGDAQTAYEFAQKAYDLDRTMLPVYQVLGEAALLTGDYQTARQMLETFLLYQPKEAESWLLLGRAYAGLGTSAQLYNHVKPAGTQADFEKAIEAINRAMTLKSNLPGINLYRGLVYLSLGQGQNAVNDFVDAKEIESDIINAGKKSTLRFPITLGLGRALLLTERTDEAFGTLNSAAGIAEDDLQLAAVYLWRAQAAEKLNRVKEAVKDWQSLMEMPKDSIPENWFTIAAEHLKNLSTPTPTLKVTFTPVLTKELTITKTSSSTIQITKTTSIRTTPEITPTP